jgi:hypothetical protein
VGQFEKEASQARDFGKESHHVQLGRIRLNLALQNPLVGITIAQYRMFLLSSRAKPRDLQLEAAPNCRFLVAALLGMTTKVATAALGATTKFTHFLRELSTGLASDSTPRREPEVHSSVIPCTAQTAAT